MRVVAPPTGLDILRRLCAFHADVMFEIAASELAIDVPDARLEQQITAPVDWYRLGRQPLGILRNHLPSGIGTGVEKRTTFCGPIHVTQRRVAGHQSLVALPIFLVHTTSRREANQIEFTMDGDVRVNMAWLDALFGREAEEARDDILIRLGVVREDADHRLTTVGIRNLADCWQALRDLVPEFGWIEARELHTPSLPVRFGAQAPEGIHPCILALDEDLPGFTKGLITDLREIAKASDDELGRSALVSLLSPDDVPHPRTGANTDSPVLAEQSMLNASQQDVVKSALSQPLTVVQGPPGTGKSTVVRSSLLSLGVNGSTALFGSMNHKAVDAVVKPMIPPYADRPLVADLRENGRWTERLLENLGADSSHQDVDLVHLRAGLAGFEDTVDEALEATRRLLRDGDQLVEETTERDRLAAEHPDWQEWIHQIEIPVPHETLRAWLESSEPGSPLIRRAVAVWHLWRLFHRLRQQWPGEESPSREDLVHVVAWKRSDHAAQVLEARIRGSDSLDELSEATAEATAAKAELVSEALPSLPAAWASSIRNETQALSALSAATGGAGQAGKRRAQEAEHTQLRTLLPGLPLWAITSLSVHREVPRVAGAFDLAIIDEAGQCHAASALPILFRAKRAMFVGDPQQLRPIANIAAHKEEVFRTRHGLEQARFSRFMFGRRSAYDLAHDALLERGGQAHLLREHYRCHPTIAEFFNRSFYDGRLLVRTSVQETRLANPGIIWTDLPGGSTTVGSSRWHPPQVAAIVDELRQLADNGFDGSVGVVTPFREHAKRIRDAAHRELGARQIDRWSFISDTADGFQGGERDVIFFGLVGGGDTDSATPPFYMREHNRFNVAVSRARIQLHVFGNKAWARSCPVPVLSELVLAAEAAETVQHRDVRTDLIGPVWEPRLAEEMRRAGLEFHQQYPTCGFFLDFAFHLPSGGKVDVEVDGEAYHRDRDGNLRAEDVRRDLVLRANGWRVKRFWVYELREDMGSCIQQIKSLMEMDP